MNRYSLQQRLLKRTGRCPNEGVKTVISEHWCIFDLETGKMMAECRGKRAGKTILKALGGATP